MHNLVLVVLRKGFTVEPYQLENSISADYHLLIKDTPADIQHLIDIQVLNYTLIAELLVFLEFYINGFLLDL